MLNDHSLKLVPSELKPAPKKPASPVEGTGGFFYGA
jgi:hypothetical protein